MKTVPDMLRESAATYEERNKLYGDNYKVFGHAFYPLLTQIHIDGPDDLNRLAVLIQIMSKLSRYCQNFDAGGHDDSLLDLATYAAMLRELDMELNQSRKADNPEVMVPADSVWQPEGDRQ